nr:inositol-1-phosphate synthase [Saccharomyces cerevisiae]
MTEDNIAPITSVKRLVTDKCTYKDNELLTKYSYENAVVTKTASGRFDVTPTVQDYVFKLDFEKKPEKTRNYAHWVRWLQQWLTLWPRYWRISTMWSFQTKAKGVKQPNYFGSMTQCSTLKLGIDAEGNDVYAPFNSLLPMVSPKHFVVSGWDINNADLYEAMQRSQVLEYDLQQRLKAKMSLVKPLPSIYYPDFIAANQDERANQCINLDEKGNVTTRGKWTHLQRIRRDIQNFKEENALDKVIVLWTANTERYVEVSPGVNDTMENLLQSIKNDHEEIAPSTIFAAASILEGVPYINGSPQNTFVPGLVQLAEHEGTFIAGDDLKSGQTKLKSVLAQFLVDAGIKPVSIASYNHLGNNDGYNLSAPKQFRSKEISKSSVIDDIIASNDILYNDKLGKKVDHCIVIKYMKPVGDSKVAMDEYYSELMLGGHNRISIHNVCEDSLLATALIIDLLVMTEFCTRVSYKKVDPVKEDAGKFENFYPVLTFLSYWLKAPLTRPGFHPVNGLNKQRTALENFLRLLIGLPSQNELRFEERLL